MKMFDERRKSCDKLIELYRAWILDAADSIKKDAERNELDQIKLTAINIMGYCARMSGLEMQKLTLDEIEEELLKEWEKEET